MRTLVLFLSILVPANADTLIVGVLGGWQHYDSPQRAVRKLALRLRNQQLPNVSVETFENHHLPAALEHIKRWSATQQTTPHRLILYGQSFGGAAAVHLDRQLAGLGIPVSLSVHIDSIGSDDRMISANVAAAANFFQREAWPLKGQPEIRADDPSLTKILGNFEYHYRGKQIDETGENWAKRALFGTHLKMEDDPALWREVEKIIMAYLN